MFLGTYDPKIADIEIEYGPNRRGDIPHSLASIDRGKALLGYNPQYSLQEGLKEAISWYWKTLK
jgi:UDP-N-acetylglucosamine 4-epimerase